MPPPVRKRDGAGKTGARVTVRDSDVKRGRRTRRAGRNLIAPGGKAGISGHGVEKV